MATWCNIFYLLLRKRLYGALARPAGYNRGRGSFAAASYCYREIGSIYDSTRRHISSSLAFSIPESEVFHEKIPREKVSAGIHRTSRTRALVPSLFKVSVSRSFRIFLVHQLGTYKLPNESLVTLYVDRDVTMIASTLCQLTRGGCHVANKKQFLLVASSAYLKSTASKPRGFPG